MEKKSERLLSLDAFRGLSMFGMLLVDYPGDWDNRYSQLMHALWNGFTLADLMFPSFLFIVGVAIVFSLSKRKKRGDSDKVIMKNVLKRAFVLIVLGLICNAFLDNYPIYSLKTLRIMGVLQRIAIAYVLCAFLYLKFTTKSLVWIGSGILFGYWAIISLVPVPGYGAPELNIHPSEKIANISVWLDWNILGSHIAEWNKPFDNEGILSTLPCFVTCLLGILTALFIRSDYTKRYKSLVLTGTGLLFVVVAQVWNIWYPINKLLWSGSYVLFAGGLSIIILAAFYWIIDQKGYQKWSRPLQVFGKNAILVFTVALCLQGALFRIQVPFEGGETAFRWMVYMKIFKPLNDNPLITSMLYAVVVILFWYTVSWLLDKRNIYLRV